MGTPNATAKPLVFSCTTSVTPAPSGRATTVDDVARDLALRVVQAAAAVEANLRGPAAKADDPAIKAQAVDLLVNSKAFHDFAGIGAGMRTRDGVDFDNAMKAITASCTLKPPEPPAPPPPPVSKDLVDVEIPFLGWHVRISQ